MNIFTQEHGLTVLAVVIVSITVAIILLAAGFVIAEWICEEFGELLF